MYRMLCVLMATIAYGSATGHCQGTQAGMTEVNHNLVELLNQQARDNVQLFQTLAQPTNWGKATHLHNEFLRASWQRAAQFARRYVEVSQAAMISALSTAPGQARKA